MVREGQSKDTFHVGNRVRVNDSCQWVSLRGESGTITKDCGGFVFTVDFGGGCYDLKVTDFEPKHPKGCDCGGFDRNGSHSAGEYVGYCEYQDDDPTEATFDAKTLAVAFDQVEQAVEAWHREPGFVKVLLEKREADAMLAFYKARKES